MVNLAGIGSHSGHTAWVQFKDMVTLPKTISVFMCAVSIVSINQFLPRDSNLHSKMMQNVLYSFNLTFPAHTCLSGEAMSS